MRNPTKSSVYSLACELIDVQHNGSGRYHRTGAVFAIKLLCLAVLLTLSSPLKAQSFYGSILGTVSDTEGAVVPDARVTVTNVGTNEVLTVNSDSEGKYSVVNLVPAMYNVVITKDGFKRFLRDQLTVQVGAVARVDATLQVGAVSQTVEVTSQAPLLQTDSSSMSQEIEGTQVQETPLNGRNIMNMIALAAGVVPQGSTAGGGAMNQHGDHTSNTGWSNYQVGGAIAGESAVYIDGSPINVLGQNSVALLITQDAVQEFSVATSNAGADFGRYGGGVVNMTTKSGSNAFHGSIYEYIRNADFNANNYFSNQQDAPRPQWNQNQYGAVASGPIKRDKAFFLFTWEGFASILGSPSPTNVPTTAMQNGIFTTAIHDPLGNCNIVNNPAAGTWTITNLFQGSCGDPLANVLRTFYPPPNTTTGTSNYFATPVLRDNQNEYNGRIDYNISTKQRFFGRYTYWKLSDNGFSQFNDYNGWPSENAYSVNYAHQAVLGDTYTFNPSTVLDVRVDYTRDYYPNLPQSTNVNESQFGSAYAALAPEMSLHVIPVFTLTGSHNIGGFTSATTFSQSYYNTYAASANLIKIIGAHSLKFGAEIRLMDQSGTGTDSEASGSSTFTNDFTGDEWADFLMGYPDSGAMQTFNSTTSYNYYQGYYVSDTWQARRNLTLNLGLRWELPGSIAEKNNKATVLLPSAVDPYTGITGTLTLVDSPLYPHRPVFLPKFDLLAPHIGFVDRLGSNTAVRGGYGISYLPPDIQAATLAAASLVNSAVTSFTNTGSKPTTFLDNPFPGGIIQPSGRSNPSFMTQYVLSPTQKVLQAITGPVPHQSYPYIQQWNLTISRELKGDWLAEIGYAGSKGTHIPGIGTTTAVGQNLNQLPDQYDSMGAALLNSTTINGVTSTVGQSLRPYPTYGNVTDTADFLGATNYNSLQAKVIKRFGAGGELLANYTWSKELGNTDTTNGTLETKATPATRGGGYGEIQDFTNLRAEYSLLSYNVPQRVVISYVVDLPFGRGKRFGSNLPGVADTLVSGWGLNGITTFQSGFPLLITEATTNNLVKSFGGGILRPNVTAGCNKSMPGSALARVQAEEWFNTACFTFPGQYAFGNEPRVDPTLSSEGIDNFDFAAVKSTKIMEKADLQFRAEFYNLFNRVQFAPPVIQHDSSQFGQILSQGNQPRLVQFSLRMNY